MGQIVNVNCLKQLLASGYGIASAVSKGLGGDFETGRGLTTFVFIDRQAFQDICDHLGVIPQCDDFIK